jgi:hypothetical protein
VSASINFISSVLKRVGRCTNFEYTYFPNVDFCAVSHNMSLVMIFISCWCCTELNLVLNISDMHKV